MRTTRPELYQTSPSPIELAVAARGLVRYHRPVVETLTIPSSIFAPEVIYRAYDIGDGSYDAMCSAGIDPVQRLDLLDETKRVALMDFPNYKEIMQRRIKKMERLRLSQGEVQEQPVPGEESLDTALLKSLTLRGKKGILATHEKGHSR